MEFVNNIAMIPTADLIPYVNNSRTHSAEQISQIRASLREFGFINPILIDKNNTVIAGHGRLIAAKAEGITEVPCVKVEHLTEAQRKAYIIADNRLAELAGWDKEILKIELESLKELNFDLDLTGFTFEDLMDMNIDEPERINEDDFDIDAAVPKEPKSKYGEVYLLGRHKLMCGDSTKLADVEKLMCGEKADILVTDPPYNVDYEGAAGKIQNDKMKDSAFRDFLREAFSCADSVMKAGAVFYIWHSDSEGYNFRGACKDTGWKIRQCLIWEKQSFVLGRQDYQWQHEPCLYGWKEGTHLWASDRAQTTILRFDRPSKSDLHPTMKPVLLIDYQIKNNTKAEDIVLDLFGGSGTTLIACEQNGRTARIMEIDPKFVDVIIQRWESLTGQKAVRQNGTEP